MNQFHRIWSLLFFFVLGGTGLMAQAIFPMSDTTVTECQGFFTDSDEGTAGAYDHNENLTFTICPPGGVDSITLSWQSFCTEVGFDFLRIYQGVDTFGTLIAGPLSGTALPPTITVPGCITMHFTSDANVACSGWIAEWRTFETIPVAAVMTLNPAAPVCSTSTINVGFDQPIHCDSITGDNFVLTGPSGQNITATALSCSGDSSTAGLLTFNPGLDQSGTYTLDFTTYYRDACDSLWELTSTASFTITDCPLAVEITASPDTICPGGCSDLTALASGGDSINYVYTWSAGLPATAGPHTVCPLTTTSYSVTVSDGSAAPPAIDSVTVVVLPPPATQPDFNICQSEPAQTLTASPGGGTWSGPGILDPNLGTFLPDSAGPGVHDIIYTLTNGCSDTLVITVDEFDAGPPMAACPGTAPFAMTGFSPIGGTWAGPNISPGGIFNPVAPGSYTVTYSLGACTDSKIINVQTLSLPADTSLCSSADTFTLAFSPFGGNWSIGSQGTQAVYDNAFTGLVDPGDGDSVNVLVYTINGCSDSLVMSIFQIDAGNNLNTCPKAPAFSLIDTVGNDQTTPLGGTWSGPGIIDPNTGLFDPSVQNNNWNATITYTFGGCTAEKSVFVRVTDVAVDTLSYCRHDSSILTLNFANTGRTPGGGQWFGPNLLTTGFNATVRPADLGVGFHTFTYEVYTCPDSFTVEIFPSNQLTDTMVCELEPGFQLNVEPEDHPAGGVWSGNGVSPQGMFDPQAAGVGTWPIYYESFFGCRDTSQVEVFPPPVVTINGLDFNYCYKDTVIPLALNPPGGLLTGTGLVGNGFNPSLAGPGTHQLTYTFGEGACTRSDIVFTTVGIPLDMTLSASEDTICAGEEVNLDVQALGGTGTNYSFNWNQNLPGIPNQEIEPTVSGMYTVVVSDGCSDPVSDSVRIDVLQPYSLFFTTSTIQCFGETGFAIVTPSVPGNYSFTWDTEPPVRDDSLFAQVGSDYQVVVIDSNSGCRVTRTVNIPGYPAIRANYTTNPGGCVKIDDPVVDFLDLSLGVTFGTWDFGDGSREPYTLGFNPSHRYDSIGDYFTRLTVENQGLCRDTFEFLVCVEKADPIFYGTFSPNGDGTNDFFEIDFVNAFPENHLQVYNRYGALVYEAAPYQNDWNGQSSKNGEALPDGVYFYIFDRGDGKDPVKGDVVIVR